MKDETVKIGMLNIGEPHPSCNYAKRYLSKIKYVDLLKYLEAFSSCAIDGNRNAEICGETLKRIINNESVSDRYFMGLVLYIMMLKEDGMHQYW